MSVSGRVFGELFHHTRFSQRNDTLLTSAPVPGREEGEMAAAVVVVIFAADH